VGRGGDRDFLTNLAERDLQIDLTTDPVGVRPFEMESGPHGNGRLRLDPDVLTDGNGRSELLGREEAGVAPGEAIVARLVVTHGFLANHLALTRALVVEGRPETGGVQ